MLAGCMGSPPRSEPPASQVSFSPRPTATAEPTPTPEPPPTPTSTPDPAEELVAACDGEPVPWAAPYAGTLHPLVVVDEDGIGTTYAVNKKWLGGTWKSPIQLVLCVPEPTEGTKRVGSCGRWTRQSDDATGELLQFRYTSTIRVVVAKTGKTLQKKVLLGSTPPCGDAPDDEWSIPDMGDDPPWHLFGVPVTAKQVNSYATTVSKQKVK